MPIRTRTLYLVRHGQYLSSVEGQQPEVLTPLGQRQAARLGKRLAAVPFSAIWHSDMPRAVETAQILAGFLPELPRRSTQLLREGIPSVAPHFGPEYRPPRAQMIGTRQRMDLAFERFVRPSNVDRNELIVAHGNIIRYLIRRTLDDATQRWWQMDILQCGLSIIRVTKQRRVLVSFNDSGHLPPKMQTYL
ncbi:MAG TPA: histidine phosphatase family protein [Polyangiaceae bacterium]|nr:histidine phosphatase family protein [Polyangiaceae bacterium]